MNLFGTLSSASILFPVIFGIYAFNRLDRLSYRALFFFFLFGFMTEVVANTLAHNNLSNNLWIYGIYDLVEGVFWIWLLDLWMEHRHKFVLYPVALIYILIWCYTSFITYSLFEFNTIVAGVKSIILIPLSCFFLLQLTKNATTLLTRLPEFWFATAILFYFASTSVIKATAFFVIDGKALMAVTWYMHSFFNIITNFIFAKAFLCIPRRMTSSY